jgi:hypothetical protein
MKVLQPPPQWVSGVALDDHELVITISRGELRLLANSIGEALEAVEAWEFSTRLGVEPEQARAARDQINEMLRCARRSGPE